MILPNITFSPSLDERMGPECVGMGHSIADVIIRFSQAARVLNKSI